jgi:hypothetical protein
LRKELMKFSALPPGFVHLRAIDPTIAQDIRYAGSELRRTAASRV